MFIFEKLSRTSIIKYASVYWILTMYAGFDNKYPDITSSRHELMISLLAPGGKCSREKVKERDRRH